MNRRVMVTGLGMITPVRNDVPSTWESLCAGRSGIARITRFDTTGYRAHVAGEVKGFDPLDHFDPRDVRRLDRVIQLALVATAEAVRDAELQIATNDAARVGVIIGTGIGGLGTLLAQQQVLDEKGPRGVSPFIANALPDVSAAQVAIALGARGPSMAIVSACASGGQAIGEATEMIRRGAADVMIAGGSEAVIVPLVMAAFGAMRALTPENDKPEQACKPFDRHRNGFVLSEGAAVLILEESEHALARGARPYAEVIGYASGNDAYHMAMPAEEGVGIARVMSVALADANIGPTQVDYINAHGTGTIPNDKYESAAIRSVFGEYAYRVPISSTKSMMGHMMGAAGAAEAIIAILTIVRGLIPPTINLQTPDPECDLDYVPLTARKAKVRVALSNSIGLGGHNTTLVFRSCS
jgi:3-oxoacyl-[acyl-carrier-protein] synthase II